MVDGLSLIGYIERMGFHINLIPMARLKCQLGRMLMMFGFQVIMLAAAIADIGYQADGIVQELDKSFSKL
jgi:uncharacterized membrane protein